MKQKKYTKRALCMSVLSMLLCCSMLIGTTFAWFTDSVTSGKNKIVAGNLDVELEYSTTVDASGNVTGWQPVNAATNLFKADTLWEPGHTEYVYLRIRNAGTLALKYDLTAAVFGSEDGTEEEKEYTNAAGDPFKLSEHLVFNVIDGAKAYTDRSELWLDASAEEDAMGKLDHIGKPNAVLYPVGSSDGDSEKVFTLAVYMPTSVDNEANYQTGTDVPTIYLGLTLNASQVPYENDSFGDNYDKDATDEKGNFIVIKTESVTLEPDATTNSEALTFTFDHTAPLPAGQDGTTTVVIDANALPEDVFTSGAEHQVELTVETEYEEASSPSGAMVSYALIDLTLTVDGNEVHGFASGAAAVTTKIASGLRGVTVVYNGGTGDRPTDINYDPDTGELTFKTNHFSQFEVLAEYAYDVEGRQVYIRYDEESGMYLNKYDESDTGKYIADIDSFKAWEQHVYNDEYLGQSIYLLRSLDLTDQTWTTAGNFQGVFNGLNNTLSHMGKAFLAYIRGGEIKNLTLQFDNASGGLTSSTSYGSQDDPVRISHVTLEGSIRNGAAFFPYIQSKTSVEAGAMKGEEFIIENCTNNADVTGTYNRATAFVGTSYGCTFTIRDCVNNGDLFLNTSRESHGAAFAGYVMRDTSGATTGNYTCTLERCTNNGSIYTIGTGDGRNNVGGMISTAHEGYFVLTDCVNNGSITGYSKVGGTPNIGGLIGRINSGNVTVTGCTNTGTITARTTGANANAKLLFGLGTPKVNENNTESGETVVETNYSE